MGTMTYTRESRWGREIIVGSDKCGFTILPIINGDAPESSVLDLFCMHIFHGDEADVGKLLEQLKQYHIGKPAALLGLIAEFESNYRDKLTPNTADERRSA